MITPADLPAAEGVEVFISYRRRDGARTAHWLRRALLRYRLPEALRTPERSRPLQVFLDTTYERATVDFYDQVIRPQLLASRFLIVIATPAAVLPADDGCSNWVEREIADFRASPNGANVLVARGAGGLLDPLPGTLSEDFPRLEVVDLRGVSPLRMLWLGKSFRLRDNLLKLVAEIYHITGSEMPVLRREEARWRAKTRGAVALGAVTIGLTVGGLTLYGYDQARQVDEQRRAARDSARVAQEQRRTAARQTALAEERGRIAGLRRAEAQRNESVRLSATADQLVTEGNAPTAILVALEALPYNLRAIERPVVGRAIDALRRAVIHNRELAFIQVPGHQARCARFLDRSHLLVVATAGDVWRRFVINLGRSDTDDEVLFRAAGRRVHNTSDCAWLLAVEDSGAATLVNTDGSLPAQPIAGVPAGASTIAVDPLRRFLGISESDGAIDLRDLSSGRRLPPLTGHLRGNAQLAFSPDGTRLASAGYDGTARIWWLDGSRTPVVIQADEHALAVGWSKSGDTLFVGSYYGRVSRHDAASGTLLDQQLFEGQKVRAVSAREPQQVVVGLDDGRVAVWTRDPLFPKTSFRSPGMLVGLTLSAEGTQVATSFLDGTVRVSDISYEKGREIETENLLGISLPDTATADVHWDSSTAALVTHWMRKACASVHGDLSEGERRTYLRESNVMPSNGKAVPAGEPRACARIIWP